MKTVRSMLIPVAAIIAVCAVVAGIAAGGDGVLGAVLGGLLVALFLGSTPAVMTPASKGSLKLSVPMALGFLATKMVAVLVLMLLLFDVGGLASHVDAVSLGITAMIVALAWTALQIRAFPRQQVPTYDLDSDA